MSEFPARAGSIPIAWHGTVGSTNAEALTLAATGERGPLFVATETQSAGRGRRGREWISQPGNLHATLLIADPAPPALSPQLCFVAALALHDAVLDACTGLAPTRLKLKWPNDLLLDGKKVAGILVEGNAIGLREIAVAVGFGVNCKHHPFDTQFPAADFAQAGFDLSPLGLLVSLGMRWEERVSEWSRGEGFAATRAAWLLRASGVGDEIEVRLPYENIAGVFETIGHDGALVLRGQNGSRQMILAGDVFPLNAKAG
jgi:BirA family transcriptional regulator, biotin operon repressor / biotin---[acetyl-CoA-carboxylase] ligase